MGEKSRRFGRISRFGSDPPAPPNEQVSLKTFPVTDPKLVKEIGHQATPGQFDGKFGREIDDASQLDQHISNALFAFSGK